MVGSVSTEMYGKPRPAFLPVPQRFSPSASATSVLLHTCATRGGEADQRAVIFQPCSTARTKRAPTTDPIEPPIRRTRMPQRQPAFHTECLSSPQRIFFAGFFLRRCQTVFILLESRNFSTSFGSSSLPSSTRFLHLTGYAGDYALSYACDGQLRTDLKITFQLSAV